MPILSTRGAASYRGFVTTGTYYYWNMSSATTNTVTVTASSFNANTTNWTIECFFYTTSYAGDQGIITRSNATGSLGWYIQNTNGNIVLSKWGSPSIFTGVNVTQNIKHHMAIVNSSGSLTFYLDGSSVYTTSKPSYTAPTTWNLAGWGTSGGGIAGYISNLRCTTTVVYSGSTYTVPTAPLTAITGTTLLTAQSSTVIDNGPSAYTLTNSGATVVSTSNFPF
jgi:hypothetical protein